MLADGGSVDHATVLFEDWKKMVVASGDVMAIELTHVAKNEATNTATTDRSDMAVYKHTLAPLYTCSCVYVLGSRAN